MSPAAYALFRMSLRRIGRGLRMAGWGRRTLNPGAYRMEPSGLLRGLSGLFRGLSGLLRGLSGLFLGLSALRPPPRNCAAPEGMAAPGGTEPDSSVATMVSVCPGRSEMQIGLGL